MYAITLFLKSEFLLGSRNDYVFEQTLETNTVSW